MFIRTVIVVLAAWAGVLTCFAGRAADETLEDHRVVVYYLYKMPRCETCLRIEAYAKEALDSTFTAELADGTIEWHAYDTDLPEYAHYWKDFELEVKSLVVAAVQDSEIVRWKVCSKVWDLVDDKQAFLDYVRTEIKSYLHGE